MMNEHLSDEELQLFAVGQPADNPGKTMHVNNCTTCQEQIADYRLIIAGIREQPVTVFDFDLAAAVLPQLPALATPKANRNFRPFIIAAFVLITLYLFRNNFLHLASGISSVFLLISIAACTCIITFRAFGLYRKYEQQIKKLNYAE